MLRFLRVSLKSTIYYDKKGHFDACPNNNLDFTQKRIVPELYYTWSGRRPGTWWSRSCTTTCPGTCSIPCTARPDCSFSFLALGKRGYFPNWWHHSVYLRRDGLLTSKIIKMLVNLFLLLMSWCRKKWNFSLGREFNIFLKRDSQEKVFKFN